MVSVSITDETNNEIYCDTRSAWVANVQILQTIGFRLFHPNQNTVNQPFEHDHHGCIFDADKKLIDMKTDSAQVLHKYQ